MNYAFLKYSELLTVHFVYEWMTIHQAWMCKELVDELGGYFIAA